jgi:hypothetical protein
MGCAQRGVPDEAAVGGRRLLRSLVDEPALRGDNAMLLNEKTACCIRSDRGAA